MHVMRNQEDRKVLRSLQWQLFSSMAATVLKQIRLLDSATFTCPLFSQI